MNHAMVLTGVHLDEASPKRWKIENSWGNKGGKDGYYICSDTWFDRFVYQAVINKKHLSKEQLALWEKKPIVLKPWDPMGSLAD
jgi:bleomycin hydrolase